MAQSAAVTNCGGLDIVAVLAADRNDKSHGHKYEPGE